MSGSMPIVLLAFPDERDHDWSLGPVRRLERAAPFACNRIAPSGAARLRQRTDGQRERENSETDGDD
ncbi:MAG: hypothetical protein DMG02_01765 [Acidobacteria bacterium]|nr:MAG: hypothetical protein DMG03_04760 [Acidobacteriota bacterium]PYQ92154.1 MAG: hypothetical protein DMG02_01765 [Acidobacteriota bacterium]PYR06532.1 MAG: hypothetical protein DMG00_18625 [Acidobacteriota bacterium]